MASPSGSFTPCVQAPQIDYSCCILPSGAVSALAGVPSNVSGLDVVGECVVQPRELDGSSLKIEAGTFLRMIPASPYVMAIRSHRLL